MMPHMAAPSPLGLSLILFAMSFDQQPFLARVVVRDLIAFVLCQSGVLFKKIISTLRLWMYFILFLKVLEFSAVSLAGVGLIVAHSVRKGLTFLPVP